MGAYRALAHLVGEDRRVDQARAVDPRWGHCGERPRVGANHAPSQRGSGQVYYLRAREVFTFDALRADDTGARLFGPQDPTPHAPPLHSNPAPPCPPTKSAPRTSW